jgi:hypothetical protein
LFSSISKSSAKLSSSLFSWVDWLSCSVMDFTLPVDQRPKW